MKPQVGDDSHHDRPQDPVEYAYGHLLLQQRPVVTAHYMAQGQSTYRHDQGLVAGHAAHAGDHRHQHSQGHQLLYGVLKTPHHRCGDERGDNIHGQPYGAAPGAEEYGRKHVIIGDAGHATHGMLGLFLDDIDHVVHGDAAQEHVVLVHHRR